MNIPQQQEPFRLSRIETEDPHYYQERQAIEEDNTLELRAQFLIARCQQLLSDIKQKMDNMP